ncbi:MAG: TonB-dependent receptor, partial [Candidatus Marinimicrobia bacterium]|nr:TonB-dependent receptor [Candidatus Neomarinimicrobiota bacterium]
MKKGSIVILILFISFNIQAATTGKISGRITDKESGVPLMGTNVFILNSNLGAFTDIDGYFNILNVKAGKHDVSVQMIGYTPMTKVNAIVQMDLTTKVNFAMSASAIEMDAIIAEADRPIVQLDMSSSQMNISAEEIEALPVSSVSEVVGLQAGAEGLTIRGSSSSELSYNIDGLLMNDERSNTPYTSISMASIEMLKVQTGGFNAEYANANSGVVNITTKEGNRKYYSGAISIKYDPPQPKHFENSIYDPMGYHLRPYNDPEVMWTGTDNGAWDEDLQRSYPSFMGFNALSRQLIEDNNPDNDLSPAAVRELFLQQYRQKENTDIPDYVVDFGFGGPVPGFSNLPGNLRFFLSYREEQSAYVIPLSRDTYKDNNLNLKLTWDAGPKTKINMVLMNGKKNAVTTTNWSTPSTGAYFQSTWSVANLASNPAAAFIPSTYNPQTITRSNIGLTVKHQFDSNSFAELYFNSMSSDYHAFRDDARDSTLFDLFAENEDFSYMINEFPYGYYPNGPGTVIGLRTDWMGFAMDESEIVSNTLKGDYTNQINHYHQIKTGFVLASTNNKVNSWLENDKSTWRFYNEWDQNPLRFGTYIQDKMEYEELIVNAGIRVDMYNVRADWYDLDTYDELLNANNGFDLEEKAPTYKTKTISSLNPRLGIAHPISLKSKLYFNYGHFSMVPQSQYLYIVDRLGGGSVRKLGNPELEFSKSIQYEIGYEHSIIEEYLLKIAGYYKDEKNRPDWTSYTNYEGDVSYSVATSN